MAAGNGQAANIVAAARQLPEASYWVIVKVWAPEVPPAVVTVTLRLPSVAVLDMVTVAVI